MTRVGIIKPAEVKKPQAETKPKEPEKDVKRTISQCHQCHDHNQENSGCCQFNPCKTTAAVGYVKGAADKKKKRKRISNKSEKAKKEIGRFVSDSSAKAKHAE